MVVMLLGLTVQAQELKTYDQFFLEAMIQREKGNNDAAFDLLRATTMQPSTCCAIVRN